MYQTEIARQITLEILEITECLEEMHRKTMPAFMVKMYEQFLLQKQKELKSVGRCLSL